MERSFEVKYSNGKEEEEEGKRGKEEEIQMRSSNQNRICQVCFRKELKYTCPKCNVGYCCLECYKIHNNSSCIQSFQLQNLNQHLKSMKVNQDQKKHFAKILLRNYVEGNHQLQQDQDGEEEEEEKHAHYSNHREQNDLEGEEEEGVLPTSEEELRRILKKMNLDKGDLNADLSLEEQVDFIRALTDGRMGKFISPWLPWWNGSTQGQSPSISSPPPSSSVGDNTSKPPKINKNIPLLSSLSKVKPSKLLGFNLIDILYSYAYTMRIFNGDLSDLEGKEAASSVLELSSVLSQNRIYQTSVEVLQFVVEGSLEFSSVSNSAGFSVDVLHDVSLILSKSDFILSALSDLIALFERTEKELKSENESKELRKKTSLALKKIVFYLSWVNDQISQKESSVSSTIFDSLSEKVESYWSLQKDAIEMRNNKK
eukprot:TRINITY_DN7707_c0_g1_i1.p1 TRINITY_DN7707_c0_g1~~TRINITY_DN7707_c0_g1_i1.p1  ORF type:complete len:427 (+),score=177.26 TRINITY_DN7707_c0_g1_i1:219-1499(+)